MSPTRFFVLTIFWTFTFAFLTVAVALSQKGDIKRPPPGVKPSVPTPVPVLNAIQTCTGPETFVQPNGTFPLTCQVDSPLGGAQMLVLPEIWVAGNGCI